VNKNNAVALNDGDVIIYKTISVADRGSHDSFSLFVSRVLSQQVKEDYPQWSTRMARTKDWKGRYNNL